MKDLGIRTVFTPLGDDKPRSVCSDCGHIDYDSPENILGVVCTFQDKILLCRRAIEPRTGFWTLPAGHMERGETTEEGAAREAREESGVDLVTDKLLAIYEFPNEGQIHYYYLATAISDTLAPNHETLEAKFFEWKDIPWGDLAFNSTHNILNDYLQSKNDPTLALPIRRNFVKPKPPQGDLTAS
jgi:ADP-ribose pyrophosphatase YjhB (NUDIX family)